MPVIAARTREQLRASVGVNLGYPFRLLEADATGTTTTFLTDELSLGGADEYNGSWLVFTSGANNDGLIRRVTDSSVTANRQTLTFYPAVTDATADGDTAELWNESYNPESIHDFINQAILDAYGEVYDRVEDITLHADGTQARFDIPSGLSMLQRVQYRSRVSSAEVHPMSRTFDEATDADFTQAVDTKDFKRGSSLKLTIGGSISNGDVITDSITSLDLSGYTHIEGWVKAAVTLAAADFVLHLDSGAVQADGSDLESLNIPATTAADTWTFFRIALANPETDTAVISIGLEYNANAASNTVWFDEVRAVNSDSAVWSTLPNTLWRIDKEARDLILSRGGAKVAGYNLLKLVGGDKPALLTADATANEIDDWYVITRATALALMSEARSQQTDQDARATRAGFWWEQSKQAKQSFPMLVDVRQVE